MPKRIQRQRTKGWRTPAGCVYVGRPTKWGNPFAHDDAAYAVRAYRRYVLFALNGRGQFGFIGPRWAGDKGSLPMEVRLGVTYSEGENNGRDKPLLFHQFTGFSRPLTMIQAPDLYWITLARLRELRGKDLACWCPLDQPCHADVLLELANQHG